MVSFGTIDFNQLKGHNPVMASGPNAWQPRRHQFVWANGQQPDRHAYHQMIYNFKTLSSGNVQPMRRGEMNHFRDSPNDPFPSILVNTTGLYGSTRCLRTYLIIKPHVNSVNMLNRRPAIPSWNLFKHKKV